MTRLLVVGLDGGTDAVVGLPDAGLTNIAAIRAEGASAELRSTVPPITAAAWPSMMTGWNPGRHGMYDFRTLGIERYSRLWGAGHSASFEDGRDFVNSRRWSGAAFWDQTEGRVAVLSVPMTYPAWPVDGRMVSGFPLPSYDRNHSQPPELAGQLPPLLHFADRIGKLSDQQLAESCRELIERQREIVMRWLREDEHEVVVVVFQSTDFAQHRLWKYLGRPGHPLREALLEMYRAIDEMVGEARELMGAEAAVAVVSDHGFGPHPTRFVRTDSVLRRTGLLVAGGSGGGEGVTRALRRAPALRRTLRKLLGRLPGAARDRIAARATGASRVQWSQTSAYRIPLYPPAEGVVVNLRGRQAEGSVEPGEQYEAVRDRIIVALEELRDPETDECVVQWAKRREQLYSGGHLEEAPDVIALFDPRYKGASGLGDEFEPVPEQILDSFSGVHAMDGIFAIAGSGVRAGVDLGTRQIVDVAPTLLALLGRPVPSDSDGDVMAEALADPAAVREGNASYDQRADGEQPALTAEEEATLEASLRALGYLD
jgi:predicted AlkP superfamily phosphohydrolase/phosphomutase